MRIAANLVLMGIGAVLTWGVHLHSSGVDLNAIGAILVGMGVGGVALSAGFWNVGGGTGFALDPAAAYRDIDGRHACVEQHEIL